MVTAYLKNNYRITYGAIRQAVVQWMLCKEHPPELAKRVAAYAKRHDVSRDPSKCHLVMKEYIDEADMSGSAWGGDNEITSLWWKAVVRPLFFDQRNCMGQYQYIQTILLYLYHSNNGDHYDRIIPRNSN